MTKKRNKAVNGLCIRTGLTGSFWRSTAWHRSCTICRLPGNFNSTSGSWPSLILLISMLWRYLEINIILLHETWESFRCGANFNRISVWCCPGRVLGWAWWPLDLCLSLTCSSCERYCVNTICERYCVNNWDREMTKMEDKKLLSTLLFLARIWWFGPLSGAVLCVGKYLLMMPNIFWLIRIFL